MASRVEICSLITSPSVCCSSQYPDCRAACSIEVLLELDVGPRHHSLATEKQHGKTGIPCNHRTHLADAHFLELTGNRLKQRTPDAMQPPLRFNRQRKYPAAGCGPEFPGASLANDKAQHVRICSIHAILRNQEETLVKPLFAVTTENIVPVSRLGEFRYTGVKRDHLWDVRGLHTPDPYSGVGLRCSRIFIHRQCVHHRSPRLINHSV